MIGVLSRSFLMLSLVHHYDPPRSSCGPVALATCLQSPERYLLLRWAALTSLSDQVILTALRVPQIDHPPGFSWPNGPNRAGPYLTNNQAQLHLGWISLDDSLSLGFILPHLHLLKKMIRSQLINLN